jgi:hypothetical protein
MCDNTVFAYSLTMRIGSAERFLLFLGICALAGVLVYGRVVRPEGRACRHMMKLCGLDEAAKCQEALQRLRGISGGPDLVDSACGCVRHAQSCAQTVTCLSAPALPGGAGHLKDFVNGVERSIK